MRSAHTLQLGLLLALVVVVLLLLLLPVMVLLQVVQVGQLVLAGLLVQLTPAPVPAPAPALLSPLQVGQPSGAARDTQASAEQPARLV